MVDCVSVGFTCVRDLCVFELSRPGHEVMYGFSHFTASLNEPEEDVAPTDCRLRPDQRVMEEGDFPKANNEKVRRFIQPYNYFSTGLFMGGDIFLPPCLCESLLPSTMLGACL